MLLKVRTKNHTGAPLRKAVQTGKKRVVYRLGSVTPTSEIFPGVDPSTVYEINTAQSCKNSGNKIVMKGAFLMGDVKTAELFRIVPSKKNKADVNAVESSAVTLFTADEGAVRQVSNETIALDAMPYPIIAKHKHSSKGNGIYLLNNGDETWAFIHEHYASLGEHIFEKFYNFSKEHRLHVTKDGCFYTCRKMLKSDAKDRWHRHDSNSVWMVEENPLFEKPSNWAAIEAECVKALHAVGLTIGACDVKVQTEKGKNARNGNPDFIVMEINSGPAMGEITIVKYEEILNKIVSELQ